MTPELWRRVRELFDAALDRDPAEREDFLRQSGEESIVVAGARRLLRENERSGPLDKPVLSGPGTTGSSVFSAGQVVGVGGRYRILRYIGRGGMGEVYEAEDQELKERVALKTLLPEIASDEAMIARFKQEIQLARRIGHPNVCRVFDLARDPADASGANGVYFLTMEFLPGETLWARLQREGRLTPAVALPLLEQMAQALDAAHRAGVIHRDLKPSNVMLVPGPQGVRAVVTDFGLARRQVAETDSTVSMSGQLAGTWDYMAPELLAGAVASVASDVYALGMVAFRMVAGVLPFEPIAPEAGAVLRARQAVPSPRAWIAELDPRWEGAILRALDRDPARRFSSALGFPRALRGEMSAITIAMPLMTRRRWAGASLAVLILGAGGLVWRAWVQARNRPSPEAAVLYRKGADDLEAGAFFAATKALGEAVKLAPSYALAHARLAEAWVDLEMPERASEEMLLARRQDNSGLSGIERLRIEAVDLTITREYPAAAAKYEQAVRLAGPENLEAAMDLARAYEKSAKPDKAIEVYRRAAEGPAHNPAAWLKLGVLYARQSDVAKSEEAFQEADRLYQLTSNLEGLIQVAFDRGVAANRRGKLAEGAAYLQKAIETSRAARNLQQEIRAKLQLANNAYLAADNGLTERYAREALETAQANQMESEAVVSVVQLGNAYFSKRDYAGAERYYQQALEMARRSRSARLAALCLFSLASLHNQTRRPADAAREAQEALAFFEPNRWVQESFLCLALLGRAQRDRDDLASAQATFQRLLEAAQKSRDPAQLALAHESIGSILFLREQYPQALEYRQQTLSYANDAQRQGYAALQCGTVLWRLGRYDEAQAMFEKAGVAAAKLPSLKLALSLTRAEMLLSRRQYAAVIGLSRAALEGDPGPLAAEFQRTLGLAKLGVGDRSAGRRNCEESLRLEIAADNPEGLLDARLALIEVRTASGEQRMATDLFAQVKAALADRPESNWRTLALLSSVDRQYDRAAREAFGDLRRQWGEDAFRGYQTRPDVKGLSRPLFPAASAK
jgi:tetratricopeptide (TPR) repeat protein